MDQSLSNSQTADKIVSRSNGKIKFLYRQTRHFNMKTKKLLTSALIQCHFEYASASWYSGLTKKYKNRLQTTQNKIVRFLLNAPPRNHIGYSELSQINMLPVDLRVKQLKLNQIHNIVHGKAPMYLQSSFSLNTSRHNTRSGPLSLSIPSVKSFGLSSFNYTGAVAWNDLPGDIKSVRTKPMFKSKVKQFLFNKCLEQRDFI